MYARMRACTHACTHACTNAVPAVAKVRVEPNLSVIKTQQMTDQQKATLGKIIELFENDKKLAADVLNAICEHDQISQQETSKT